MKSKIFYACALLCAAIMTTSCNEEETLPQDTSSMGAISCNRAIVGTNQKVLFACEVFVSEHAKAVQIEWENKDGMTLKEDSYEQGISYRTFMWDTPGDYPVKCKTTYIYGSEVKTAEKMLTITVHKPHFQNSFIGDNLATVLNDNPDMVEDEYENNYIIRESPSKQHRFRFFSNLFHSGQTLELTQNSIEQHYLSFMAEVKKHEKDAIGQIKYEVGSSELMMLNGFTPTDDQRALFDKFSKNELLTKEEQIALGQSIDSDPINLVAQVPIENLIESRVFCITIIYQKVSAPDKYCFETIYSSAKFL